METLDTLFSRKVVRNYTGKPVSEKELKILLKAANSAPVGRAKYENLHLSVIRNTDLLNKINEKVSLLFERPDIKALYGAPLFILVSAKTENGKLDAIDYANATAIIHNLALAATDLGLGSCYIWGAVTAITAAPDLEAELQLPEGMSPCFGIVLGETEEEYSPREIPEERIATTYLT
jgi:FMN reductase (NADPH)